MEREAEQTRQHIDTQVARLEKLRINERLYEEVTGSLFYPNIFSRQEQVANEFDGIEHSYEWIFTGRKPKNQMDWASFPEWLASGSGVYWIKGKAGSGKSTLMNYICNDKREETQKLLKQWGAGRRFIMPTFFFWNAGVAQQKTVDGLLRSLIYQMLKECRELIDCFSMSEPLHAWNNKRLLSALVALSTQTRIPIAICAFIDGLDELDDRYDAVIETIRSISDQSHVKICLSSRPLLAFEKAYAGMPSLSLQDFTYDSILAYARVQLLDLIQQRISKSRSDKVRVERLLQRIVDSAEGVFLWAVLAVREVRDGLQEIADLDELALAIEGLPAGVENLYLQMLSRIKPIYRREAARFIQTVLYYSEDDSQNGLYYAIAISQDLDLYTFYFIDKERISEDQPLNYHEVDMGALVEGCYALKTRLLSHTMGLLDLVPREQDPDDSRTYDPILRTVVHIHHRTIKDFFLHNASAKNFIHAAGSEHYLRLSIARGTFAYNFHLIQGIGVQSVSESDFALGWALVQVIIVEHLVGVTQSRLMRSLYRHSFELGSFQLLARQYEIRRPYIVCCPNEVSIDFIGIATHYGMLQYVCEVLDLPLDESPCSPPSLVGLPQVHSPDNFVDVTLSWEVTTKGDPRPSDYRQWLSKSLVWGRYHFGSWQRETNQRSDSLTETYLLACCRVDIANPTLLKTLRFIRLLLQTGANPMASFIQQNKNGEMTMASGCFWNHWLYSLPILCNHLRAAKYCKNPSIGPLLDRRVTLQDLFNTTKTLLVQGADIYHELFDIRLFNGSHGISLDDELDFQVVPLAMSRLHECFNEIPEFREYAAATKSCGGGKPWRTELSIIPKDRSALFYPKDEELKMLWSLIEKWEETRQDHDLDLLRSATRQVWKAHGNHFRLEEKSERESGSDVWTDESSDEV